MFLGLYGAGKTTTIAKLGNWYAKRGKKVVMVGLDVHRPAAKEQLEQLGKKNNVPYFVDFDETDAVKTWKKFEKKHDLKKYDLILVDTAGRHTLDKELIKEIKNHARIYVHRIGKGIEQGNKTNRNNLGNASGYWSGCKETGK